MKRKKYHKNGLFKGRKLENVLFNVKANLYEEIEIMIQFRFSTYFCSVTLKWLRETEGEGYALLLLDNL